MPSSRAPRLLSRAAALIALFGAAQLFGLATATAGEGDAKGDSGPTKPAVLQRTTVDDSPAVGAPREDEKAEAKAPAVTDGDGKPAAAPAAPKPAKKRRGGINPCMTPDPGFGIYDGWDNAPSVGQMIMPHKGGITKSGQFDVIIHFHGHEPIRKEFVKTAKGAVLVGIDLGIGSGAYQSAFSAPHVFTNLLDSIEAGVAKHAGVKQAKIRKLGLSAWSAGYGAIEQILRQPAGKKVDSIILLDSLHAGYVNEQAGTLKAEQLTPFIDFARRAAAGKAFMYLSHSAIIPPGYASTTEVAHYVEAQLKGKPKKVKRQDVLGLDMIERFDRGNLHVRGYTGDDKPDHCAHIGLMADIVKHHIEPRWKSPRGKK